MIAIEVVADRASWDEDAVERVADRAVNAALLALAEPHVGDLEATILLTDDAAVRELNRTWRGIDRPTNVLSFPSNAPPPPGGPRHLGDIALAHETCEREAVSEGKSLDDHVAHLVIHGLLHLLGHDHEDESEAQAMERTEIAALALIGIGDPYRDLTA